MNEEMKQAWAEISKMLVEPTPIELDVFLRTWQRAIQAEREACAKVCEPQEKHDDPLTAWKIAEAIRARGQA